MRGIDPFYVLLSSVVLAVALLVGALIWTTVVTTANFRSNCVAAGGHIYKPDSTSWCVRDGLVVEVYP